MSSAIAKLTLRMMPLASVLDFGTSLYLIPTVCLGVTSFLANTYGYDDGKSGPTRCALIGDVLGDRCRGCWACRTPPVAARSTRSALAVGSRPASPADPGGFHRSRTTSRSGPTSC